MGEILDYYFEFSAHVLSMKLVPAKYCVYRGSKLDPVREYVWNADRIWVDGQNKVFYVKHRTSNMPREEVDLKEFMWIKLSAQDIK